MSFKFVFVKTVLYLFGAKVFSKMLLQCERSSVYKKFCKTVYGRDLCQANMVCEEQLQKLISVGQFKKSDRVLDLGCGLGYTTEYLSDISGAAIFGIDFAEGAISSAIARTAEKRHRLDFKKGNLNLFHFPSDSFDFVISIDTLYFVNDLERTILDIKKILKPEGKLLIFYSSRILNGSDGGANSNKLGVALYNAGFNFQSWDFTQNEKEIWDRTKGSAEMLKAEFKAEGNFQLYKGRVAEAERNLLWQNQGIMKRYLYSAKLISG